MSTIFLFTGENSFALTEEKKRWKSNFIQKYGEDTLMELDGSSLQFNTLMDEISALPFLAEKRLVFVRGVPTWTKEQYALIPTAIHPSVILVFVDPKPDKRGAGIKKLLTIAETKEFAPLKGASLRTWMQSYEKLYGLDIDPNARTVLVEYIGEDQALLAQEIQKLALGYVGRQVTSQDIEQTVIPTDEGVIWRISDLLCAGNKDAAFIYARRMIERGTDAFGLWAILLSVLRNIVQVRAALDAGHSSPKDVADASGVHIFAIRSLLPYAKKVKLQDLHAFINWAAETEVALKTGTLRSTEGANEELLSCIDTFLVRAP